jgi:hypothetical protein
MGASDGGPAFPVETMQSQYPEFGEYGHQASNATWQFGGITVRDYFAAKAMQSYMVHITASVLAMSNAHQEIAEEAYSIADAMIAARETKKS